MRLFRPALLLDALVAAVIGIATLVLSLDAVTPHYHLLPTLETYAVFRWIGALHLGVAVFLFALHAAAPRLAPSVVPTLAWALAAAHLVVGLLTAMQAESIWSNREGYATAAVYLVLALPYLAAALTSPRHPSGPPIVAPTDEPFAGAAATD